MFTNKTWTRNNHNKKNKRETYFDLEPIFVDYAEKVEGFCKLKL